MTIKRTDIINHLISKYDFKSYLEIVVENPNQINNFKMNVAVNKLLESDYEMPSLKQQLIKLKSFYNK